MTWKRQEAFGGQAIALLYNSNALFAVHDNSVWRFDPVEEEWSKTLALGSQLVVTDNDYLFTDWGWRLVPGEMRWTAIDAEAVNVGSNGRTIFGMREDRATPIRSNDYGETWTELPVAPTDAIAIAEASGNVYVSLTAPQEGVWYLKPGSADWQITNLDQLVTDFHVTPENHILAKTSSQGLYWSENGDGWHHLTFDGQVLTAPSYVGRDADSRPLIATSNTVYVLTVAGELEPLSTFPGHEPVLAFAHGNTNARYLSDDTGLWRFIGSEAPEIDQIGMPGNFLRGIFHLSSGTYGAFDHGRGSANWQRFDPLTGRWHHVALASALVKDVVELPGGRQLLATQSVEEGGYGDVYTLNESGELTAWITAGPEMIAAAVDDQDRWFVATGDSRGELAYQVLISSDGGATWSETELNSIAADLATICGTAYAATPDGIFSYADGQWRANTAIDAPVVGIRVRDENAAFFSADDVWYTSNCMNDIESVALPPTYAVDDLAIDTNGGLWLVSKANGIVRQPGESGWFRFDAGLPDGPVEITVDNQGTAWAHVRGVGLYTATITP